MNFKNLISETPVVILCGGKGTRMKENGERRPKPMIEVGGRPILWHIMKIYAAYGLRKFILPLGYKGSVIKKYFSKKRMAQSEPDWEISLIETGSNNLKGSRIKQVEKYIKADQFLLTYGDGVCDINIEKLIKHHLRSKMMGTVSVVRPPSRFGEIVMKGKQVVDFQEKPQMSSGAINGGFFVFNSDFLKYLSKHKDCDLEFGPLQKLAKQEKLGAFRHEGFWQCMDTPREREFLENLWKQGAPWKKW